jgi:hypothetical protein
MNSYPFSNWQKNTDDAAFDIPANNTPICNITDKVAIAYALRKVNASYNGALIRIRRARDNREIDIFANQFGDLDIKTLQDFVPSGSAFVTTWYDQSGNGRNAVQTSATLQPQIVRGGDLQTLNGKPTINFTNTNNGYANMSCTTSAFDWNNKTSLLSVFSPNKNYDRTYYIFRSSLANTRIALATSNMSVPTGNLSSNPTMGFDVLYNNVTQTQQFLNFQRQKTDSFLFYYQWGESDRGLMDAFGNGLTEITAFASNSMPSLRFEIGILGNPLISEIYIFNGYMNPNQPTNLTNRPTNINNETYLNIVKNVAKYNNIGLPI